MRELHFISAEELPTNNVFGRDIRLKDYRKYLGTTQGDIFYDASGGLFVNAFAALLPSVSHGHHFYLHLPAQYKAGDPDHQRLLDFGLDWRECHHYFNQRLRRLVENYSNSIYSPATLSNQQSEMCFTYPAPQCFLGQRGSGKSTALAEKIRWLQKQGVKPVLLVSPFVENRETMAQLLLIDSPEYILLPPDEALRKKPFAQALVIDEAAALPPAQLLALTAHYPAYTLATTTDGYEGSANSFMHKTLAALQLSSDSVIVYTQQYRHQKNDGLEQFYQQLFLSEPVVLPSTPQGNIRTETVSQTQLFHDETLLEKLWQLLKQAHYRTRPEDLKRLLDLPQQEVILAIDAEENIWGVLQIVLEQPLPVDLANSIVKGKRRPRGRMLMQQLLLQTGQLDWAQIPLARIQRIAVAQNYRQKKIASHLLAKARMRLATYRFGTVYTHSELLHAFWQKMGYDEIYRSAYQRSRHHGATSVCIYGGSQ